jgi:hypothetical protein
MKATVAINSFVRRQTPESSFTHWNISDEELLHRIQACLEEDIYREGYRDGVILVPVEFSDIDFMSGLLELKRGDTFVGVYESRRPGEEPRKSFRVCRGLKHPAKSVEIVLYRHDVLNEGNEAETDADWEVISVNGYPTDEPGPIDPITLMHNHYGSDGGTPTNMTDEEFAEALAQSFEYYKDKALIQ